MLQIRSARPVDLPGVAAVLQDAFGDKLRVLFGNQRGKVHKLLEAMYRGPVERGYSGLLVAERDARVIGALAVEPIYYTMRERRTIEHIAVTELGALRALRASYLLWLLSHAPQPGDAHIGLLAVVGDSQGEGIAGRLLAEAEQWADQHDRRRLTLLVAEHNQRARHVYERAGLAVVRARRRPAAGVAFGARRWLFMAKPIRASRVLVSTAQRARVE